MTSWTARIDALLAEKPCYADYEHHHGGHGYLEADATWMQARLALAAERLREPHTPPLGCLRIGADGQMHCTCGKDSDLLRILEGR